MPIITRNKAKGVEHADEIPITMTQKSGSSQGTTSRIKPFNLTTLDLVPSLVVPTYNTPPVAINEPLSDCFGLLVNNHIFASWIDSHILPYSHLLPCIPLCRLLVNPAIRTQNDCVAEFITLIAERGYQLTMARFIVTECFPRQCPVQFDRCGVRGRELHMSTAFDDQILQISELKHVEEEMFVVWDGNHRLLAWREWAYRERLDKFMVLCIECTLVALNPTRMAEFLLVLGMINKVTHVHVPQTTAHDIFMMQKLGLANPKSILDNIDNENRAKAERVLCGTAMNCSKWLRAANVPSIATIVEDTSGAAFQLDVEKSKFFARWLIGTLTTAGDDVLHCLAGCGGMATECKWLHRHCISIEKDVVVFQSLLSPQERLPKEVGTVLYYGDISCSEELERATSLQPPAQPHIPHFYPTPTPQPPSIAQ
ncbi:hypothetical protein L7F22_062678 [Adiantum nelumboides]|nr:hypothetical protein [Adiantum nelumboides]